MSYENPTRAIDTQTGQHLANLQNTISGTFQGIAKTYKAEQDTIAKELKNRELANAKLFEDAQLKEDTLFENVSKTTARYGISQGAGLNKLINETNDLINANNSGKLSLDQITLNKQKIAAIGSSVDNIKRLYGGITQNALSLTENKAKNGTFGGLDKFGDPEVYEDLMTWLGTNKGSRELLVETLDNGIDLEVYAVINGRKYSGTQIQRLLGKDSQLVTTIPDPRKDWDNLTNATLKEEMLEAPVKDFTKPDSKGRVFEIVTRKTKKDDLLAAGGADAKASIEAMSPRERAALWNNELAPKDNLGDTKKEELVDISIANTEEFNKKLQKAWTDKWFETKIGDSVEISRKEYKQPELTYQQQLTQDEIKTAKDNYNDAVKLIDSSEDDLNFGAKGYDFKTQYKKIFAFAGRTGLSIKVTQLVDSNGDLDGIIIISRDNKSEIVLPKGSSDKQVRDAIKASALGGAANYKQSEPTNENKGAVGDRIFEKKKNNKS